MWRTVSSADALSTTTISPAAGIAASRHAPISAAELYVTITIPTSERRVTLPHLCRAESTARSSREALADQEPQVLHAVPPRVQFHLAQSGRVHDGNLAKANTRIADG